MINIFPEFESRQVLTSDELNWMGCYLDSQNRQTRRFLVGCGLIGGLQVKLVNNSVQVTNGIGVTSAGHIVSLFSNNGGITTFTRSRPYTQKSNEKLAYHYLPDQDPVAENYSNSVDQPSLYFPGFTGEILELLEDTENEATPINGAALNGKIALLFAEIIQKELKDCEDDNCQERGKKYLFNTRLLVISQDDARLLLSKEYGIQTQSDDAIDRLAFPWLHLPNINILKPVFSNKSVNTPFSEQILVGEYARCIKDFRDTLQPNKVAIEQALTNLKNYCAVVPAGNVAVVDQLLAKINSSNVLSPNNQSPALTGLVYDYLWCFVKAYQELQAEAQQLKAKCFTREEAFPNHILLGIISAANNDFDAPVYSGYSIYRHYFQSRLVQTQQAEVAKKITVYLKRLETLANAYDEAALPGKTNIRITTGGNLYDPLSAQAIPYYLKQTAVPVWNAQAGHQQLNKYNTTYGTVNDNQVPSTQIAYNTLPYAMQGHHHFFRIEGVYGQPAVNALNAVFQLRKKHGMAFEVLMLRLNEKAPFSHSFNFTINEDIESMYQVVRAEVLKQISLNINYLWALELKSGKFTGIRNILEAELEKSYKFFLHNLNLTILTQPLELELNDAIMASNITTNYKSAAYTTEAKYAELETVAAETKAVASSYMKKENAAITGMKYFPATIGILQPIYTIGILFFNTLGNLVATIKSDKFKNTSDISFYSHLLKIAKAMQKNEEQKELFLYALRLYCALKLQEEYLADNFLELDIVKYRDNLEDELIPASEALMNYLRPLYYTIINNDEILYQVNRQEMLEHAGRIRYDDDWIKIIQLDAENKKRNGGLGVENLLEKFVKLHPGLAHGCGVPKGGTYIMVYDAGNQVTADFYLPYIISSHLRPIQFTLLENKTITLSGTIKDAEGKALGGTSLLVGNATVVADKDGFYNALVTENSTVKIICKLPGYTDFSKDVAVADKPVTENIVLQPVQPAKFTTTVNFRNQLQQPVTRNITLLNKTTNETVTAQKGVLTITEVPKKTITLVTKDANFEEQQFDVVTAEKDQTVGVQVIEVDFFRIQVIGKPQYIPSLFNSIKITDPDMEVDTTRLAEGFFVTKERVDVTKPAKVTVVYNQKPVTQEIKPGPDANQVFVEGTVNEKERKLPAVAGIIYGDNVDRLKTLTVNGTTIAMTMELDTGQGVISSTGQFDLTKEFPKTSPVPIDSFPEVKAAILVIDSTVMKDRDKVTTKMLYSFTMALTNEQYKSLLTNRPEFKPIARATELRVENFYCLVLPPEDIKEIRTILGL